MYISINEKYEDYKHIKSTLQRKETVATDYKVSVITVYFALNKMKEII